MKNDPLISVVVPVYNAEEYLHKCIESVINQTYLNLEIILINDGSIDNSGKICDEYAQKDNRIIVIHQENLGRGLVRKTGIKIAKGDYIGFVDSDDWVDLNAYEVMVGKMILYDVDMVMCGVMLEFSDHSLPQYTYDDRHIMINEDYSQLEFLRKFLFDTKENSISPSLCNKLHRRCDISKYLELDNDICVGEDGAYIYSIIPFLSSFYLCSDTNYHYNRINDNSIMNNINTVNLIDKVKQYIEIKKVYSNLKDKKKLMNLLNEYYLKGVTDNLLITMPENLIQFTFPKPELLMHEKIVIYGAGVAGESYLRQFSNIEDVNIIAVVDKYAYKKIENIDVLKVSEIKNIEYDKILIAIYDDGTACDVINELTIKYDVDPDKIIWQKPLSIAERMFYEND